MTTIKQDDVIRSVADALQYISFYHPADYIANLARAYEMEESHAAKDAIAQILINSRMCAEGHRPICQDTGIVTAFVKVGMEVQWEPSATFGMMDHAADGRRRRPRGLAQLRQRPPPQHPRRPRLHPPQHRRQHPRHGRRLARGRKRPRHHCRVKGRRQRSQIQVRHAQPLRLHRRLGPQDRPHHGRRLVPSRHARHRHRRHRRKGHGHGQGVPHGPHRHAGAHRERCQDESRGTPHRALHQGQQPRHRSPGPRRPHHRPRRQDHGLPHPRRQPPRRHDPQLRRHPPPAHPPRRLRPRHDGSRRPSASGPSSNTLRRTPAA